MSFLSELWLPIILSAVFVFIASSVLHMLLPFHRSDYRKMANEASVLEAMRSNGVEPGSYMFPHADSMKNWNTPEMQAKVKQGPVGTLTIVPPGGLNMGKNLVLWFAYSVIVAFFVAYIGWISLEGRIDVDYLLVFRVTGPAAVLGYAVGYLHDSIWKGCSWKTTGKFVLDGFIYALITAGTFGWLWPESGMPTLP
ncbi:MAG: hypothetical protein ACYTGG_03850 [Planctomycetota bacterium]|jgi:hypothetical protein